MSRIPIAPVVLLLALGSCRAVGGITGNEYAKPQSKLDWAVRPDLDPPSAQNPTVWMRYKDASGTGLDLAQQVRQAVEQQGYRLVPVAADADYQLVATLRHFDKAKRFDGGESAIDAVESVAPIGGAIVGASMGSSFSGRVFAGAAGFAAGTLVSAAIENAQTVAEWDLILDLQVNEHVAGGFKETTTSSLDSRGSAGADAQSGASRVEGSNSSTQKRTAKVERERTHLRNDGRLVAVAYQMTMSREEALQEILPRLPGVIASALP